VTTNVALNRPVSRDQTVAGKFVFHTFQWKTVWRLMTAEPITECRSCESQAYVKKDGLAEAEHARKHRYLYLEHRSHVRETLTAKGLPQPRHMKANVSVASTQLGSPTAQHSWETSPVYTTSTP
jgi:hypothetical protein